MSETLTPRQREILHVIEKSMQDRGYPPSVREIGEAVGLNSPSTVHNHLATLQKMGYLRRDPTKPRAIEVRFDTNSEVAMERRPARHVPLIGDVAAGTGVLAQENVEDLIPLPTDFTGEGELFMLRVRGESMVDAGILDGDFVVAPATRSSWCRRTRAWPPWSSPRARSRSTARSSPSCAASSGTHRLSVHSQPLGDQAQLCLRLHHRDTHVA